MKKTLIFILLIGMFSSCKKQLDDYGVSPNDPLTSSPALLLSGAEVGTFANFTGSLARTTNLFTQHIAGVDGQLVIAGNYDLNDNTFVNEWTAIYQGTLVNTNALIKQYGEGNPYYTGITQILIAMNLSLASDLWGDVPYTDAFGGLEKKYAPKYDTQADIYNTILPKLLDDAVANLSQPESANKNVPAADDLIFGGEASKWILTARILKARFANRLSQVDAAGSATKALAALNAATLVSSGESDMMAVFFNSGTSQNQWYAYSNARPGYMKMGKTLIDYLSSATDPRLPFYAEKDKTGGYSGNAANDAVTLTTSEPGKVYVAAVDAPLPLVTYVEAKFIEAEAQLRLGQPLLAANAYNAAVIASVRKVTGAAPSAPFILANASETAGTITLAKIIKQKYIALYTQVEPYNDYRRTGLPALVPNSAGVKPQIPLRLPASADERLYNPNATIVTDIYAPVFWDK